MDFNERDGFDIINRMISTSRQKINNNSFYFLLWGWTVFVCACTQYLLMETGFEKHYLLWPVLTTAATVTHIVYAMTVSRKASTKTYLDSFLMVLWVSIWGTMCLGFGLAIYMAGYKTGFMVLILLYSLGACITGIMIRFRPLIFGAVISWLCCINIAFIDYPEILLAQAISIAFCFIIPGYLLKMRRSENVI